MSSTKKTLMKTLIATVCLFGLAASTGWSQILSYNFTGFNNEAMPVQQQQVDPGDTLGVDPASGWQNFNLASGASDQTFTDGGVSLIASNISGGGGATSFEILPDGSDPNTDMLAAGWNLSTNTTLEVTGLSSQPKDIYLYLGAGSGVGSRSSDLRLTGTTFGATTYFATLAMGGGAGDGPTTNNGTTGYPGVGYVRVDSTNSMARVDGNYVLWEGVTDTSFTIDFPAESFLGVTGLQVVTIPEPSSFALLALGSGILLMTGRRRRHNRV